MGYCKIAYTDVGSNLFIIGAITNKKITLERFPSIYVLPTLWVRLYQTNIITRYDCVKALLNVKLFEDLPCRPTRIACPQNEPTTLPRKLLYRDNEVIVWLSCLKTSLKVVCPR